VKPFQQPCAYSAHSAIIRKVGAENSRTLFKENILNEKPPPWDYAGMVSSHCWDKASSKPSFGCASDAVSVFGSIGSSSSGV